MEHEALLLRAEQAGKLLNLGRSTIYKLMAAGELRSVKVGRSVRIPRREIEAWIAIKTERRDEGNRGERSEV